MRALAQRLLDELEESVIRTVLDVGETAPDFTLQTATDDRAVWLAEELAGGPVVVSFYRGQWCPYCNPELKGIDDRYQEILDLGASVYFIGPETRENQEKLAAKTGSTIPLLYDLDGAVMRDYGVEFTLPEYLRPMYARFSFPETNPRTGWRLPMPATFVIAREGTVVARHVNGGYTRRMETGEIIAALKSLA